jgi:hypothetical protein
VGGQSFPAKGSVGTPFFSKKIKNIDILGNFGHFVAENENVPKSKKIAQNLFNVIIATSSNFFAILSFF